MRVQTPKCAHGAMIAASERRLDFFVVGVQKAGTTALHEMLSRRPDIQMASGKEVHFFDDETINWNEPDCDRLHSRFSWKPARVRGEATPITIYWPNALERLHAYNPNAKIIVALRHPAHRAFSHWRMERERGYETLSFSEAIREGRQRVTASSNGAHRVFSYVERGYYDEQIERLLGLFPRERVHFYKANDLFARPRETLGAIFSFLGAQRPSYAIETEYVTPVPSPPARMDDGDLTLLRGEFEWRFDRVERLTGVSLLDWRAPDYEEPMRSLV